MSTNKMFLLDWLDQLLQLYVPEAQDMDLINKIADSILMWWILISVNLSINKSLSFKRLLKISQQEKCQDQSFLQLIEIWPINALLETESKWWEFSASPKVALNLTQMLTSKLSNTSRGAISKFLVFNHAWTQMGLQTQWASLCQILLKKIKKSSKRWKET